MTPFAVAYFFSFGASALYGPLAPTALLAAGLGAAAIGRATALMSFGRAVVQPLWGRVADRTGHSQRISALSFGMGALALSAIALVRGELWTTLCFFCFGALGGASVTLLDSTVITAVHGDRTRYSRVRMFGTLGYAVATFIVSGLRQYDRLPNDPLWVFAPAAVLFVIAATALALRRPTPVVHSTEEELPVDRVAFAKLAAIATLQWASHAAYVIFVVPLGAAHGIGPLGVGVAIFAGLLVEAVVLRYASRIRWDARVTFMVVTLVAVVRWTLYPLASSTPAFVALSALHGVTFGLFYPTLVAETARIAGKRARHRAQSLMTSICFGVGGAIGTPYAGWIFQRYGADAAWWAMVPLGVFACMLAASPSRAKLSG